MNAYERIKKLAEQKNTTITAVEQACGMSQNSILKWKKSSPSGDKLTKIADYFDVSVDYILGRPEKNAPVLTEQEQRLLYIFRNCPQSEQHKIMGYAEAHMATEKSK